MPSRWTKDQLEGVRRHLHERFEDWHLLQLGPVHGEDGQPHVAATLARVRPDIAAWTTTLPHGILELTPWMTPVASRPPQPPATAGRHDAAGDGALPQTTRSRPPAVVQHQSRAPQLPAIHVQWTR